MARDTQTEPPTLATRPAPPGKITYEEFLDWADEDMFAEWVDGEVVWISPITEEHDSLIAFLHPLLRIVVEVRGLGRVFSDPFQMKTGPDLPGRAPDLMFVAPANLGRLRRTCLEGPADLVVEIVSPESRQRDSVEKLGEYEQGGVRCSTSRSDRRGSSGWDRTAATTRSRWMRTVSSTARCRPMSG